MQHKKRKGIFGAATAVLCSLLILSSSALPVFAEEKLVQFKCIENCVFCQRKTLVHIANLQKILDICKYLGYIIQVVFNLSPQKNANILLTLFGCRL